MSFHLHTSFIETFYHPFDSLFIFSSSSTYNSYPCHICVHVACYFENPTFATRYSTHHFMSNPRHANDHLIIILHLHMDTYHSWSSTIHFLSHYLDQRLTSQSSMVMYIVLLAIWFFPFVLYAMLFSPIRLVPVAHMQNAISC